MKIMREKFRLLVLSGTIVIALLSIWAVLGTSSRATVAQDLPSLDGSFKDASPQEVNSGSVVDYSIVLKNGDAAYSGPVLVTDALTDVLDYEQFTLEAEPNVGKPVISGDKRHITYTIDQMEPLSTITVSFQAKVASSVERGSVITNTAVISEGGTPITRSVAITVPESQLVYFPIIFKRYPPIPYAPKTFYAEGVNDGDTQFTLVWDYGYTDFTPTHYELDESTDNQNWSRIADNVTGNRLDLTRASGTYYYRVRGVNNYGPSAWTYLSGPVVTGFFDDFSNPNSGWYQGVHYIDNRPVFDRAYENGSYRMKILLQSIGKNNRKIGWEKAPYNNPSSSYTVEVDHRFARADDQGVDPSFGKAGLVFGANGDLSIVYVFEWSWEGRCAVNRYDNVSTPVSDMNYLLSQSTTYRNWGTCGALRTGYDQTNTIRVVVEGNGARFYINGSEINSNNPGGIGSYHQVGLMTGSWDRTPVESRFDNFEVAPR